MILEADPFAVVTSTSPNVPDDDADDILANPQHYKIPENAPVLPPLMSRAKVDFAVNEKGVVMVLFDQELPEPVHWVEYDMDIDTITFVTWNGKIFELGMRIPRPFKRYMRNSFVITLIHMEKGEYPAMMSRVPLVQRLIGV